MRLVREARSGMHVAKLAGVSRTELYITAVRESGQSVEDLFRQLAELLREDDARIVSFDVYGLVNGPAEAERITKEIFGDMTWPMTWLAAGDERDTGLGGIQVWAVSGIEVEALSMDGHVVGSVFELDGLKHCRLGGLVPSVVNAPRSEQAREIFERMETALRSVGMEFTDVLRTWFFNADILEWYDEFNGVRDGFFKQCGVYDGLVPASTGVSGVNGVGAALAGMLLAVRGEQGDRFAGGSTVAVAMSGAGLR